MIQKTGLPYVESALRAAHEHYVERNTKSHKLHIHGHAHLPGGNTRTILHTQPFPLTFDSGNGAKLTSVDGDTYVDFLGEYSAGIYGHSNPIIADAVAKTMKKGWNFGGQCTDEKVLAQKVVERFQASGIERVRFTNSGTEANTMAIAGAVAKTGRDHVVVCSGGYHGSTLIFPIDYMHNPRRPSSNLPHKFVFVPYNNISETKAILERVGPQKIAAILVEPLQGAGGCRPGSPEYLHFLRQQADELAAVLIVDEVMASRLGPNGYCASIGLQADIITLGKYLGGGMTFGAFGGKREIMQVFDPSQDGGIQHPGTYNNNCVTMAAGIAGLKIYDSKNVHRLNELGRSLKVALQEIFIKRGIYNTNDEGSARSIIEIDSFSNPIKVASKEFLPTDAELPRMFVTGEGSLLSVRCSGDDRLSWQALLYHHFLSRGIHTAPRGYIALHLELNQSDVMRYVAAIEEFLDEHQEQLLA